MCGTWHASGVICFQDDAHRNAATQTRESCQTLGHVHEQNFACVQECEVSVLFTLSIAYKGIAICCKGKALKQIQSH